MWVAYKKFSDDLEFACDERVIGKKNEYERKAYAMTLLNYAARTPLRFAERLYFGCEKIRDRIESIIDYKDRNRFLIAVFVLILFKDASLLVYASRQVVKMNADKQTSGARSGFRSFVKFV